MNIVNIAGYKFISLNKLDTMQACLKARCLELDLRGTIILAGEGINLFLAGPKEPIESFLSYLREDPIFENKFADLTVKESFSNQKPFKRMIVRQAKEIITMRHPLIKPEAGRAPFVEAITLRKWLEQGHDDEGRPVVMLDTRNAFEVEIGTFDGALGLGINRFGEFPEAIQNASKDPNLNLSEKTIVTFCTGGIRCEKAALYMQEQNLSNVYQLEGGILKYFEEVGSAHYHGDCFVFDERVALDPNLNAATEKTL